MVNKNTIPTWLQRALLFSLVLISLPAFFVSAKSQAAKPIVVRPSNVLTYLDEKILAEPNIDPKTLAQIGNRIIQEKGFDFRVNACEIVDGNSPKSFLSNGQKEESWDYSFTLVNGEKLAAEINAYEPGGGGMCAECFFDFPTRRVSNNEMLIVVDGIDYRLKRPRSFILGQAWLMDSKMKKVLRTWELPYQRGPQGISADGTKLYFDFYSDALSRVLVLELSEDGSTKFLTRSEIDPQGKSKFIKTRHNVKNIGDVAFFRVRVKGKSFIIRSTSPCSDNF